MDIVRIILKGYGYDIGRLKINYDEYEIIKKSKYYKKSWTKNLYEKVIKKFPNLVEDFRDVGLVRGELIIYVNDKEIISIDIGVIETLCNVDNNNVELEGYQYPFDGDVIMTTIQELEGIFMDSIFVTKDKFDFNNFKFIFKDIHNENNETIIKRMISEVYYDGEIINFNIEQADLRMSVLNFDINKKNYKNEKN